VRVGVDVGVRVGMDVEGEVGVDVGGEVGVKAGDAVGVAGGGVCPGVAVRVGVGRQRGTWRRTRDVSAHAQTARPASNHSATRTSPGATQSARRRAISIRSCAAPAGADVAGVTDGPTDQGIAARSSRK
jgi:hypothetical protein